MKHWISYAEDGRQSIDRSANALELTLGVPGRRADLADLGARARDLIVLLNGITFTEDDEIVNWTLPEVAADLGAASWNIASGWYKVSAACLRSALDVSMASLYFSIRERNSSLPGGCNRFFSEWDRGERDTPNWGEMKPIISQQQTIQQFNATHQIDIVDLVYSHFKRLSAYTHSRQWEKGVDLPIGAMWIGDTPGYDAELFERFLNLMKETVGWIATLWIVNLPEILAQDPLDAGFDRNRYAEVLFVLQADAALDASGVHWA